MSTDTLKIVFFYFGSPYRGFYFIN